MSPCSSSFFPGLFDQLRQAFEFIVGEFSRRHVEERRHGLFGRPGEKGPHQLLITYAGGHDPCRRRLLEPHGLLLGMRRYLVAREVGGDGRMQHFRLDRIASAQLEASSFQRDPAFNLTAHSGRAFGSYHAEAEFGEVVWRFTAKAAPVARAFTFHPAQQITEEPDGSLTVRFLASGHLEMAWHLYHWGDAVEVLAPAALKAMVDAHRRNDFPSLP